MTEPWDIAKHGGPLASTLMPINLGELRRLQLQGRENRAREHARFCKHYTLPNTSRIITLSKVIGGYEWGGLTSTLFHIALEDEGIFFLRCIHTYVMFRLIM